MKGGKIPDDFFKDEINYNGLEDRIYNQLAKTMARNIDIDFAKTPIVDILTGYTKYREAEEKVEQLENIIKEAIELTNNLLQTEDKGYYQILFQKQLDILNKGSDKE